MPIEYRFGDLFTSDAQALAHGCNTKGLMGAGIALQFQNRYPEMFTDYRIKCLTGQFVPGSYYAYKAPDGKIILNLATQTYPGAFAKCEWIEASLLRVLQDMPDLKTIALPTIGAGLGGLRWEEVQQTLQRVSYLHPNVNFIVYKFL